MQKLSTYSAILGVAGLGLVGYLAFTARQPESIDPAEISVATQNSDNLSVAPVIPPVQNTRTPPIDQNSVSQSLNEPSPLPAMTSLVEPAVSDIVLDETPTVTGDQVVTAAIAAPLPVMPPPAVDTIQSATIDEVFQPLDPPAFGQQSAPIVSQDAAQTPVLFSATTLSLQMVLPPGAAPEIDLLAPSFDIVRVDANGATLVAGQAEPNATFNIISRGEIVAEITADANGEFVAFLDAPAEKPENLVLDEGENLTEAIVSQAQIVILPMIDAPQASTPVVVLATQDSVTIIQPSGLSVPDNISLDTISYNEESAVVLAGRGTPNRIARIYADGKLAGTATISQSGSWGLELADLEAGRYILRVDELNPDGSVSSRVETPFQREFPETLALSQFAQGAKVIVQPGNTLWLMASQAYGDGDFYTQIFTANKDTIRDPDLIYPGQVVTIPSVEE